MKRMKEVFKRVTFKDIWAPVIFLLLLIPSFIFRLANRIKKQKLWLVAEDGEARDNGYYFYKYIRENYPNDFCFYAVNSDSVSYEKVAKLGNVIRYGSLKHWLYYMSANLNISSQKSGNPCPMFWYFIHVILGLYRNRVFLQHGVTHNNAEWLHRKRTKFKHFVCATKKEYDFVLDGLGYKEKNILLAGFSRWDSLKDTSKDMGQKTILIMPTWRKWLGGEKNVVFETRNFRETKYYRCWNGLFNDTDFVNFIEKNDIKVYFYPHINMQLFLDDFKSESKDIKIISLDDNIQEYLSKCNLIITDYSSVAFDFAYLGKPVIYYQFDLEEYRKKQYSEGYFNYEEDGFGPVIFNVKKVISKIKYYRKNDFKLEDKYAKRVGAFFSLHDKNNSKRIYEGLK